MAKKINIIANLIDEQFRKQISKLENGKYKVNIDTNKSNIDNATQSVKRLSKETNESSTFFRKLKTAISDTFSSGKMAMTGYLITLHEINKAGKQAKQTIEDIDKAVTDLQIATDLNRKSIEGLVSNYNEYGKQLASTTIQITSAADDYLRAGKTLSEADILIKNSIMLSKLGKIESGAATEDLLAVMNGFEMSIDEVGKSLDAMVAIDMEAATSSGDIATALKYCASSADVAGMSFGKLASMIATVQDKTQQSAQTIGTFMNTVLSRYRNVKIGNFVDDDGENLSDVETILNSVGIKLRKTNQEFREIEVVIDEVAKSWKNYSTVQQAAIAKAFSGSRQQNRFFALMEGYNKTLELTEVAANSAGTAIDKFNNSYMNSIEAKQNTLQASFESMLINSDFNMVYSGIIDATTALINFMNQTNALKSIATGLVIGGIVKGFLSLRTGINNAYISLNKFQNALNITRKTNINTESFDKLLLLSNSLTQSQMRLLLSSKNLSNTQKEQILVNSGLSTEEAKLQLETWGLVGANNGLTASNKTLKNATIGLWKTLLANPLALITAAITFGTMAWSKYKQVQEEALLATQEATRVYAESTDALENYTERYKELYQALLDAKGNEEETYRVKQDLLVLQTELNDKYGDEYEKLNLVADAYKNKTATVMEYNKQLAQTFLNENRSGIQKATGEMTSKKHYNLSYTGQSIGNEEGKILQEIANRYKDQGVQINNEDEDGVTFSVHLYADAEDAYKTINDFMNDVREAAEELETPNLLNGVLQLTEDELKRSKSIVESYEDTWEKSMLAEITVDDKLSADMKEIINAVADYNEAILNSEDPYSDKNVESAYANLQETKQMITQNAEEWGKYSFITERAFSEANDSLYSFYNALNTNKDGIRDLALQFKGLSDVDLKSMLDDGIEDAFDKLATNAEKYGVSVEDLIILLEKLDIIQEIIDDSGNTNSLSFTDAISEVQSLSKGLNQLDKIYADVYDKEEFDWSSILNNEDFKTVFGELGDVYDNFISTVSNSPDDITACQNAFDDLSTAYIYNSGVLDDVTESTKTATIAMLEQLGIANATELVENALAVQKQFLAETGIELANATYEEIAAFLAESDATDDTKQALAAYQLQKELAAGLTLDTSGDIENLQNLVKACGGATTALSTLNKIKSGNLSGVNMYGGKENRDALIKLAEQEVQDALNKVSSASSTATNKVKYGGGTSAKKAKESASKSAKDSKDTSKTYNWVETAIERVERSLKKLGETASSVYKNWMNRNNALASEVTKTAEALNLQQSAYQTYMNEADKVGLSDTYKALIQNGGLRIEDITDEKLQQQIETYKDYYTKALSAADSVDELTKNLSELAKTKFDNVVSEFDDALSLIEHRADMLNASIDQTEKKGYIVSKNYYEALIMNQTSNLTKLQEEYSALTSSFEEAMDTGRIEQYSEAWYDMAGDINQVEKALTDARTSLIEYENSMRELNWSNFDKLQDYIGDITKETDFLSSLISDKKLYDDYGNFNDNGYAEMGLHGISYNTLMNQADKYGEELERINKELAEDPYNQILIDRKRELAEAQRNVVSSAMDEKDAIINLIKEAYDAQLDSLQKIIDKKKDALNTAKDLYDYENSIAEQTKKVADYRKQLIAYSGDDSEESKALVQQLTTNLADAEKALQETEYNKWKSDQEQMLDTLYSDYESLINERMDNTDGLLQDAIDTINEKSDIISDTVTTAANDVGATLSEPLENILIENRGTKDLISLYGKDFTSRWTTTNDAVNGVTNKVTDMINASNAQSQSIISAISTAANSIVSVRQAEIAAYTPPSPSTNTNGNSSGGSTSNNKGGSSGNSSGGSPSNNKGNSGSSGKLYYVVDKDGYALSPGYKTLGEAMRNVSTYRGVDISSVYKKKLYPFDPFGGNMNLFANGGVVKPTSKTTGLDKIAQSFGEDHIVAVRNNERLLTSVQNESFETLAKCAPDLIKSLTANSVPYLNLTPKNTILPSRPVSNQSVSVNIDAVQVNGVNDPQKFANELVSNLKSNTRVQNTLKDLTVTSMLGGNSLLVNRN